MPKLAWPEKMLHPLVVGLEPTEEAWSWSHSDDRWAVLKPLEVVRTTEMFLCSVALWLLDHLNKKSIYIIYINLYYLYLYKVNF